MIWCWKTLAPPKNPPPKTYICLFFGKSYKGYTFIWEGGFWRKKASYLMRNDLMVNWGFQLCIVFGIVGLEHFTLVCVDSSGQFRRWFWQGNPSTSEVDLTFREGQWSLETLEESPWNSKNSQFLDFKGLEHWYELDIPTVLLSSVTHLCFII